MIAQLRHRRLWQFTGYCLVFVVIYLSVTSRPVDLGPDFVLKDKFYHTLAYFSLMAWFAQLYHDVYPRMVTAAIFILMGIALEFVQSLNPARYFEYGDMLANTLGVIIAYWMTLGAGKYVLQRFEGIIHR